MDKIKTLSLEVRVNRIIIGALLILFGMSSSVSPLGGVAIVPLLGAAVVLSGILNWQTLPEIIEWLKQRQTTGASSQLESSSFTQSRPTQAF